MRVILQRVEESSVTVSGELIANIRHGLLVLCGFEESDTMEDISWLSSKISQLRIFNDSEGIMNLSVKEIAGELLIVSQFTLHANTKKGNRPSYIKAARPDIAIPLYEAFIGEMKQASGLPVQTGIFGADMKVKLVNDGPVTIMIDSKNRES